MMTLWPTLSYWKALSLPYSVILTMVTTSCRTRCPPLCPLLDMLNMSTMSTALAPDKQTLHHSMAHRTPGWRCLTPVTPPSTSNSRQSLATLGAGCVDSGGLLVHCVDSRQATLAQDLQHTRLAIISHHTWYIGDAVKSIISQHNKHNLDFFCFLNSTTRFGHSQSSFMILKSVLQYCLQKIERNHLVCKQSKNEPYRKYIVSFKW